MHYGRSQCLLSRLHLWKKAGCYTRLPNYKRLLSEKRKQSPLIKKLGFDFAVVEKIQSIRAGEASTSYGSPNGVPFFVRHLVKWQLVMSSKIDEIRVRTAERDVILF